MLSVLREDSHDACSSQSPDRSFTDSKTYSVTIDRDVRAIQYTLVFSGKVGVAVNISPSGGITLSSESNVTVNASNITLNGQVSTPTPISIG